MQRRGTRGWPVPLSLALHLTLVMSLLALPPQQLPTSASEPLTVDLIVGEGSAEATAEPAAPTEAPAAPIAPAAPVQQAEIPPPAPAPAPEVPPPPPPPVQPVEMPPPMPAPAPDVPPPPPVEPVEIPPPTPAPAPVPVPPPPPPPVQQADIPPPTPAPTPMPVPPPPPPVAQARPTPAPPQRAVARAPVNPGAPARATGGQNAPGRGGDANNGAAWMGKLKQWWDQHSFYPKEASLTNDGGNVRLHLVITADGQVTSAEVVQSSGLSVLDAAAVAVFRNAHLPPFPAGTPAQPADVVVTVHYRPADGG